MLISIDEFNITILRVCTTCPGTAVASSLCMISSEYPPAYPIESTAKIKSQVFGIDRPLHHDAVRPKPAHAPPRSVEIVVAAGRFAGIDSGQMHTQMVVHRTVSTQSGLADIEAFLHIRRFFYKNQKAIPRPFGAKYSEQVRLEVEAEKMYFGALGNPQLHTRYYL